MLATFLGLRPDFVACTPDFQGGEPEDEATLGWPSLVLSPSSVILSIVIMLGH